MSLSSVEKRIPPLNALVRFSLAIAVLSGIALTVKGQHEEQRRTENVLGLREAYVRTLLTSGRWESCALRISGPPEQVVVDGESYTKLSVGISKVPTPDSLRAMETSQDDVGVTWDRPEVQARQNVLGPSTTAVAAKTLMANTVREDRFGPTEVVVYVPKASATAAPRVQLSLENSAQGNGSVSSAVVACGTLSFYHQQWDVYRTHNTAGPGLAVQPS